MTQVTRSQLQTDVSTDFPTTGAGQISALILRNFLNDLIDSAAVLLSDFNGAIPIVTGQCYFQWNGATQIALMPVGGGQITIAGVVYQIPAAGILQSNTNAYISGTLSGSGFSGVVTPTVYDAYVFNNSGLLTLDFYQTTTGTHSPDTTAGNVGVEIRTGDSSRSYIGKICIDGAGHFATQQSLSTGDTCSKVGQGVGVISWFNRKRVHQGLTTLTAHTQTTSGYVEIDAKTRCYYLTFGQDFSNGICQYLIATNNAAFYAALALRIDGYTATTLPDPYNPGNTSGGGGSYESIASNGQTHDTTAIGVWAILNVKAPEGLHYVSAWINTQGATAGSSSTVDGDTHVEVMG